MRRAGFLIDLGRCTGCAACVLACRLENRWPEGVAWRRVLPVNIVRLRGGPAYHLSLACHHCERPACLEACPSGAYAKLEDGSVRLEAARCLGCRYCEMACPFGAPSFDSAAGLMTKCDFCGKRIERGADPACVAACPTSALRALDGDGAVAEWPPGFADPGRCLPSIRFEEPRGRLRRARYDRLRKEALK